MSGEFCTTTVCVATIGVPGKGKGKKAAKFEPTQCNVVSTPLGGSFFDTVTLNRGIKVFDIFLDDFIGGTLGGIELKPLGCAP